MKVMIMINTIALMLLLVTTGVSAKVFNPLSIFDLLPKTSMQKADGAFYNYGNRGYDFVVEALPMPVAKLPRQLASLEKR